MVKFDSASKSLILTRKLVVDGEAGDFSITSLDLSKLPEDVRQLLVSTVKLAIAYSNGHDVSAKRKVLEGKVVKTTLDPEVVVLQQKIDKFQKHEEVKTTPVVEIPG